MNFYRLSEVVASNALPRAIHQLRSNKKVTDLKRACFNNITGLLIADKMGEIGFVNIKNVSQLPDDAALEEERKELELREGEMPPFEENGVYKTLYGH